MKITIETLEKMPSGERACTAARDWFARNFPSGGTLNEVAAANTNDEWLVWFTCHYLPANKREALAFKFAGQAFRFVAQIHPELGEYADNVTAAHVTAARAAAYAAADAAADAADAAACITYDGDAKKEQAAWSLTALQDSES